MCLVSRFHRFILQKLRRDFMVNPISCVVTKSAIIEKVWNPMTASICGTVPRAPRLLFWLRV